MLSDMIEGQDELLNPNVGTGSSSPSGRARAPATGARRAGLADHAARPVRPLEHGWGLHISSRASTFPALRTAALPVLIAEGRARSSWRARSASSMSQPEANALGELTDRLHGPDGQRFEGVATLRYEQPPWAADPFAGERGAPSSPTQPLLGGRYLVTAGIRESARGDVYRARGQRDGATVIVKQARALVSEATDSVDTRLRLRHERRVYQVLENLSGVPPVTDQFRHGDDEFLVTSDCGRCTLIEDVLVNGPYLVNPGRSGRGLVRLAMQLARIVHDVHQRGVIARVLTPGNIGLLGDRVSLVDFGLAGYDGLHLAGGTPGYAPARQLTEEPPLDTEDQSTVTVCLTNSSPLCADVEDSVNKAGTRIWLYPKSGAKDDQWVRVSQASCEAGASCFQFQDAQDTSLCIIAMGSRVPAPGAEHLEGCSARRAS